MKEAQSGRRGEQDVVDLVPCPNCGARLMCLPPGFPLFDVQCTRCMFRAQVKTARCPPRDEIFGAGWEVLDKNLKAGQLIPPLIVNFHWIDAKTSAERRSVLFFPFLTRKNLRKRQRSAEGKRPGYREFNYIGLMRDNLPRKQLLSLTRPRARDRKS